MKLFRKNKNTISFILISSCLTSVFSIGLASFSTGSGKPFVETSFSSNLGNVEEIGAFIKVSKSISNFTISKYGFVNGNRIQNHTSISCTYLLNLEEARNSDLTSYDRDLSNIAFECTLTENKTGTDFSLLTQNSMSTSPISIDCLEWVGSSTSGAPQVSVNLTSTEFSSGLLKTAFSIESIDPSLTEIEVTLSYNFDATSLITTDFNTDIYSKISSATAYNYVNKIGVFINE